MKNGALDLGPSVQLACLSVVLWPPSILHIEVVIPPPGYLLSCRKPSEGLGSFMWFGVSEFRDLGFTHNVAEPFSSLLCSETLRHRPQALLCPRHGRRAKMSGSLRSPLFGLVNGVQSDPCCNPLLASMLLLVAPVVPFTLFWVLFPL